MVLSSVAMVELRILGLARAQTMDHTARRFVPWIWSGLVVLAATGIVLIVAEPKRALPNPAFQLKMLLLALAVAATLAFQASLQRNVAFWDDARARKVAGAYAVAALLLWLAIAVAGRWIAYAQVT
jgi:uncharacterized membrane protein